MASSCGKFILGGEHSIVVKGRGLAFPLPHLRLRYQESPGAHHELSLNQKKVDNPQALRLLIDLRKKITSSEADGIKFAITSDLPMGAGLGSSAALCVAMLKHFYPAISPVELAHKATECEGLFHQKPSGLDTFTIALEKAIFFRATDQWVQELPLDLFRGENLGFVLLSTGKCRSTREVQEKVSKVKADTPLIYENLLDSLALNAEEMNKAILRREKKVLGQLMNDSHFRLIQLGVSSDETNDLCDFLKDQGALGAKITGAGCGGYLLALFPLADLERLKSSLSVEQRSTLFTWGAGQL